MLCTRGSERRFKPTNTRCVPWCHPFPLSIDVGEVVTLGVKVEGSEFPDEAAIEEDVSVNDFKSVPFSCPYGCVLSTAVSMTQNIHSDRCALTLTRVGLVPVTNRSDRSRA